MKSSLLSLGLAGVMFFGFAKQIPADVYEANWTSPCSSDMVFALDLQPVPDLGGAYTLNGLAELAGKTPLSFPAQGGAVYDPETDTFDVSIYVTNSIGVFFAYGASLDPATLSGAGSVLTSSDFGTSSCGGTLAVILP